MKQKQLKEIPIQTSAFLTDLPTPPVKKADEFLKSYVSWVFAAANAIAQAVADIKLHLYRRKFDKNGQPVIEEIFEHEALSLLYFVNDFMTHYQLIELTQIYQELTGEGYWAFLRNTAGQIIQVWPLRPDWVYIKTGKGFIEEYVYSPHGVNSPEAVKIPTKDVIQFKMPNPINPYRGKGTVQAAAMAIDTDVFTAEFHRNFFFNGAIPHLILRTKKKLTKENLDRFMAQWQSSYRGVANAHKIGVLTGEWDEPILLGDKLKEMGFTELRKLTRDEILAIFRVGKSILNITEDVNKANAEAGNKNFMERVVTPKMTRFVAHLNEFYLKNWEEDLFFDYEDPSPDDVELKLKIYENGKNYWLTPNEIRAQENLPALKGGDDIYFPLTLMPIASVVDSIKGLFGKTSEKQKGMITLEGKGSKRPRKFMMPIPPKRLKQIRDGELKKDIKKALRTDLIKLVQNIMSEVDQTDKEYLPARQKGRLAWNEERRTAHWKAMIAKTDVFEKNFGDNMKQLFKEQEEEVQRNIENTLKYLVRGRKKGKETSFLFNLINENKKWKSILGPMIKNIVIDKGREIFEFLGIPRELDLSQQVAAIYLKIEGVEFIKEVNETTREKLKDTLRDGLVKEEGIPQLAKRVEDVFDEAIGKRSKKIARTEVLRSTNFATHEAFRQSEIVVAKEWLTAGDERVEELCEALDGKVVKMKEEFAEGEFDGMYPPLHPNCRCTIIPVFG